MHFPRHTYVIGAADVCTVLLALPLSFIENLLIFQGRVGREILMNVKIGSQ